jgi:hypothetical protein
MTLVSHTYIALQVSSARHEQYGTSSGSHLLDSTVNHPLSWTYSVTTFIHSWSSALLEKPPIVQLLKNFPGFYATR